MTLSCLGVSNLPTDIQNHENNLLNSQDRFNQDDAEHRSSVLIAIMHQVRGCIFQNMVTEAKHMAQHRASSDITPYTTIHGTPG
jgi:hypothetical protein